MLDYAVFSPALCRCPPQQVSLPADDLADGLWSVTLLEDILKVRYHAQLLKINHAQLLFEDIEDKAKSAESK